MAYWQGSSVATIMALVSLLAGAEILRRLVPPLRRSGLPSSILAGLLGLAAGPDLLALLPFDREILEMVVYHGLAVVFIAVSLQDRGPGKRSGGTRALAFGIPFMAGVQVAVGLLVVLVLGLFLAEPVHPGVGAMFELGFQQGPGQALALGAAWEAENGMVSGAQIGLVMAAVGYAWSIAIGMPLVLWGRRRGLLSTVSIAQLEEVPETVRHAPIPVGALELLTRQIAAIGVVYGATWGVCKLLATILAPMPGIAAMAWGFHFIIGALLAIAARGLLRRLRGPSPLDNDTLSSISGTAVDVITCSALAAVQIAVLQANWLPIMAITTVGGVVTLVACVWLSRRAFPEAPFEHCVMWFGMLTGTLAMGLSLLRILDPHLRSPAPVSAVLGSAAAVPLAAVVLVVLIPASVAAYPAGYPGAGWAFLGATLLFCVIVFFCWRAFGGLRMIRPLNRLWPD